MKFAKKALAVALLLAPFAAIAQQAAVPGHAPANPVAVFSIPDTSAFWTRFQGSEFGKTYMEWQASTPSDPELAEAKQMADSLSAELGVSLEPAKLFGETLSGLDIYVVDSNGLSNYLVALNFQNVDVPNKLIDRLKADAKLSSGVSGGFTADTVVEKTLTTGGRTIYLPAFEIYLAQKDSFILYSQDKDTLESATEDKGGPLFSSAYFKRFMDGLASENASAWTFGELHRLVPILQSVAPALATPFGTENILAAGKLSMDSESLKFSIFVPAEDMEVADRRYVMAAPPPGNISLKEYAPANALAVFGTNHFDGIAYLDAILTTVSALPKMENIKKTTNDRLDQSRKDLGFDPRNDFLGNLGPDLAVVTLSIEPSDAGLLAQPKSMNVALVAAVKDPVRFGKVLKILEEFIAPPPAPTPAPKAGEATPAATPVPTPEPIITETYEGVAIKSSNTLPLAWALAENTFFLATEPETIRVMMRTKNTPEESLVKSSAFANAASKVEANQNVGFYLDAEMLASQLSASDSSSASLIESMGKLMITTIYRAEGRKQEFLIVP